MDGRKDSQSHPPLVGGAKRRWRGQIRDKNHVKGVMGIKKLWEYRTRLTVTKAGGIANIHSQRAIKKNEGPVRKWEVKLEVRLECRHIACVPKSSGQSRLFRLGSLF